MGMRRYRVLVRGTFQDLADDVREELLRNADDHDLLGARFTEDGTLSYEPVLRGFSFRYEVSASERGADREATDHALLVAEEYLAKHGYGHGPLRADATCMDDIKVRRRSGP